MSFVEDLGVCDCGKMQDRSVATCECGERFAHFGCLKCCDQDRHCPYCGKTLAFEVANRG